MSHSTEAPRRYLTAAETAKLVRKALKADFPGVKFSVRSSTYAGGASIDVGWTDGPLTSEVETRTLNLYSGASFDGMIDLKSYHDSMLMGEDGPELVHFGADFVFANRRTSAIRDKLHERELRRFVASLGEAWRGLGYSYPVSVHPAMGDADHDGELSHNRHGKEYGHQLIARMGWLRPWHGERCPGGADAYCPGCGRWQRDHLVPHQR